MAELANEALALGAPDKLQSVYVQWTLFNIV